MQNSNDGYKPKWKNVCATIKEVAKTNGYKRPVDNNNPKYSNKIENLLIKQKELG